MTAYDRIGTGYAAARRADPRIAAQVAAALAGTGSVVSVGCGAGSYEPPTTVLGLDPSPVMLAQRPPGAAPAVLGAAEALPLASGSVDAALAVLTVHHWTGPAAGLAELRRVARRRVVLLTWDQSVHDDFWLIRDYLPSARAVSATQSAGIDDLVRELLPGARSVPVPVPHDCVDGFGAAYWRRPHAYLDPAVRRSISMLALAEPDALRTGLARLAADLDSGRWAEQNRDLLALDAYDAGYRLVVADV